MRRNDLFPIPAAASATQVDVGDYVYLADDDVYEIVGIDDSVSGEIRITGRELFPGDIISPSATSMIDDGPENSHRETVARVFSGEQRYEFWLPRAKNVRRMNCDVVSFCFASASLWDLNPLLGSTLAELHYFHASSSAFVVMASCI